MADITGDQRIQSEVLEGLATAVNHRRWFVELALPYLGDNPIEIGSGLGDYAIEWAEHLPRFTATEADPDRLVLLKERMAAYPNIDVRQMLLPSADANGEYSAAVSYNVLEHIEDHEAAVRQVHRVLKPGGAAVIEVPAGPHLFDVYDKVLMHYRRYELSGLRRLLEDAGLSVVHASHLGAFLYPGFWYVKRKNKRYLSAPEEVQKEIVAGAIRKTGRSRLFEGVMWLEACLRRWTAFPFGIRCLATGVKR